MIKKHIVLLLLLHNSLPASQKDDQCPTGLLLESMPSVIFSILTASCIKDGITYNNRLYYAAGFLSAGIAIYFLQTPYQYAQELYIQHKCNLIDECTIEYKHKEMKSFDAFFDHYATLMKLPNHQPNCIQNFYTFDTGDE